MHNCRSLMLVVMVAVLPACAPVLMGGGNGGYAAPARERSAAEVEGDAAITAAVTARFVHDRQMQAPTIVVDTYRGVVTLRGRVASTALADRAVTLARGVRGVRRVISRLTVIR